MLWLRRPGTVLRKRWWRRRWWRRRSAHRQTVPAATRPSVDLDFATPRPRNSLRAISANTGHDAGVRCGVVRNDCPLAWLRSACGADTQCATDRNGEYCGCQNTANLHCCASWCPEGLPNWGVRAGSVWARRGTTGNRTLVVETRRVARATTWWEPSRGCPQTTRSCRASQ